ERRAGREAVRGDRVAPQPVAEEGCHVEDPQRLGQWRARAKALQDRAPAQAAQHDLGRQGDDRGHDQPWALARHVLPGGGEIDLQRQEAERKRGEDDLHDREQAGARGPRRLGRGSGRRGFASEAFGTAHVVHCTASPTSRASGAQYAYSSATNLATEAGSRSRVESANLSRCARILGALLMRRISALSLPTISAGRFLGPASQNQVSPRTSG